MALALSTGWYVGWIVGALVVVVAAALLIIIILLGRKIAKQADDITAALDGTRENTTALFEVTRTNLAIDRIGRGLRAVRTGGDGAGEPPSRPDHEGGRPGEEARSGPLGGLRRRLGGG